MMIERLGVGVREFYREYIGDELLNLGRQPRRRLGEGAIADVDLLASLVDDRKRRKRGLVE